MIWANGITPGSCLGDGLNHTYVCVEPILTFILNMACWIQFVVGGAEFKLLGESHLGLTETKCADIGDRGSVLEADTLAAEALGDVGTHSEGVGWESGSIGG